MVTYETIATGNLSEIRRPFLLRPDRRAAAALKLMEQAGVTMFGAQESGTYLAAACARHPHFAIARATANTKVGRRRKRERGNVAIYDTRVWKVQRVRDLSFAIPAGPARRLSRNRTRNIHQCHVRFAHVETGTVVRVVAWHKPRNLRGYRRARATMDGSLWSMANRWRQQGKLGIILGDFNGAPPPLPGMRRRASVGPDSIVVTDSLDVRNRRHLPLRARRISDHRHAASVEVGIPERRHIRPAPVA